MSTSTPRRISPAERRIRAYLEAGRSGTAREIAAATHCTRSAATRRLLLLKQDGVAHVAAWLHTSGGPSPIWKGGPAPGELARPAARPKAERYRLYRARIRDLFGEEVGRRVLAAMRRTGCQALVIAGVEVWRRGAGINRAAAERVRENFA